jgi:hypothetical protein
MDQSTYVLDPAPARWPTFATATKRLPHVTIPLGQQAITARGIFDIDQICQAWTGLSRFREIIPGQERHMPKSRLLVIATTAIVASGVPTFAGAQSRDTLAIGIGDHEGVFIDGRSFSVLPGRTPEELSDLIGRLDARALGPEALIFRFGNRFYIAESPAAFERTGDRYGGSRNDYGGSRNDYGGSRNDYGGSRNDYGGSRNDYGGSRNDYGGSRNDYGGSRNDYGGSRNDYGSDRYGRDSGGTVADAERDWREWQDSLRRNARYGGSRNDYGSDRYGGSRNDYGGSRNDYAGDRSGGARTVIDDPDYAQYRLRKEFANRWTNPKGETYLGVQDQFLRQSNGQ